MQIQVEEKEDDTEESSSKWGWTQLRYVSCGIAVEFRGFVLLSCGDMRLHANAGAHVDDFQWSHKSDQVHQIDSSLESPFNWQTHIPPNL